MKATLLAATAVLLTACKPAASEPVSASAGPVVLELFTSQGCSSCPPAEELLSQFAAAGRVADRKVIPLAFHVDYWDGNGWTDPFDASANTDRQGRYVHSLGGNHVYTPQLVVGGTHDTLGADRESAIKAIQLAPPTKPIVATIHWHDDSAEIEATAPADADAWLAIWEDDLPTTITRGENAGTHTISNRIVRRFEHVAAAGSSGHIKVPLDRSWKHLGAVVFAQTSQGRDLGPIVGALELPRR